MSWLHVLLAKAPPHTPLSKYTTVNGFLYIATGALFFAFPGAMQLVGAAPFAGAEEGLVRTLGVTVMVIGYFYVFGAKTRSDVFGLATVGDRLLIPVFLVPLVLLGKLDPVLGLPFSILDPVLGIGALIIWKRQQKTAPRAAA